MCTLNWATAFHSLTQKNNIIPVLWKCWKNKSFKAWVTALLFLLLTQVYTNTRPIYLPLKARPADLNWTYLFHEVQRWTCIYEQTLLYTLAWEGKCVAIKWNLLSCKRGLESRSNPLLDLPPCASVHNPRCVCIGERLSTLAHTHTHTPYLHSERSCYQWT